MQSRPLRTVVSEDAAARLLAYRKAVTEALPDAVEDVVLFGSRARGDSREASDYDVAVLVRPAATTSTDVRSTISELGWTLLTEGFEIAPIALSAASLETTSETHTELAARIALEGVRIA